MESECTPAPDTSRLSFLEISPEPLRTQRMNMDRSIDQRSGLSRAPLPLLGFDNRRSRFHSLTNLVVVIDPEVSGPSTFQKPDQPDHQNPLYPVGGLESGVFGSARGPDLPWESLEPDRKPDHNPESSPLSWSGKMLAALT